MMSLSHFTNATRHESVQCPPPKSHERSSPLFTCNRHGQASTIFTLMPIRVSRGSNQFSMLSAVSARGLCDRFHRTTSTLHNSRDKHQTIAQEDQGAKASRMAKKSLLAKKGREIDPLVIIAQLSRLLRGRRLDTVCLIWAHLVSYREGRQTGKNRSWKNTLPYKHMCQS